MPLRATLIAAAAIAAVVMTAAPAYADPESDYVNALQETGLFPMSAPDQQQAMVNLGYNACALIRTGNSKAATAEALHIIAPQTNALDNATLISIARQYLCPDTL